MKCYTYILIALAITGQVRAEEANSSGESAAAEPYAYSYEAPDHAASEERKPDGSVQGYYTLRDADGRSRRVNYVADESGFHANVETNEHGTKTSNPADAPFLAAPANPEQLVHHYQQSEQYQNVQHQAQQLQVVQQPQVQQQLHQTQYAYQPGYATHTNSAYGYASPGSSFNANGYSSYPSSTTGYYQSGYYPGSAYYGYRAYGAPTYGVSTTTSNANQGAVYGGYNYHTPASYYAAVGSSRVVKPVVSGVSQVYSTSVPTSSSIYRSVSSSSSSSPVVGSSNYSIIQKREADTAKPAQPSQQEKVIPEKSAQEKKTV